MGISVAQIFVDEMPSIDFRITRPLRGGLIVTQGQRLALREVFQSLPQSKESNIKDSRVI